MNRNHLRSAVTAVLCVAIVLSMVVVGSAAVASRDWAWPVPDSNRLSSCFGDGRGHNAIDIAAPKGTNIVAAMDGTVVRTYTGCTCNYSKSGNCPCGSCGNLGNYIYIEHKYGGKTYVSRYGHLTKVSVSKGQTVKKGQVIGTVGFSQLSTLNSQLNFIGPLSRFTDTLPLYSSTPLPPYKAVALFSGLEPHRTLFEKAILERFKGRRRCGTRSRPRRRSRG